jgi:hypothetical protein
MSIVLLAIVLWLITRAFQKGHVYFDMRVDPSFAQTSYLGDTRLECEWTEGESFARCYDSMTDRGKHNPILITLTPAKLEWCRNELMKGRM